MFETLIDHFHVARKITDRPSSPKAVDMYRVNEKAYRIGYIIHPDCCTEETLKWVNLQTHNHNATFYGNWQDVMSRSRFHLWIDQVLHYQSTYGTDMRGKMFVLNERFGSLDKQNGLPSVKNLKMIAPISDEELFEKCCKALGTGVALKGESMKAYMDFILFHIRENHGTMDVSAIKNREAFCAIYDAMGELPEDPVLALRTLVYKATGKADLIKNPETLDAIQHSKTPVDFRKLTEGQIRSFATIFNRFKTIFMAFKGESMVGRNGTRMTSVCNGTVINRISKLSKTLHEPMKIGFWESILETERSEQEIRGRLKDLNNFRKVRIMQLVNERMAEIDKHVYPIRNGKVFVRTDYTPAAVSTEYCLMLYRVLRESLVDSLRAKACTVMLPKNCELTLPSSEKMFVGNVPMGTSLQMATDNIIGIYWRNEWGTRDFDLSLLDMEGRKIGWNAGYRDANCDVVYSGDMTSADPEAVELMYMSKKAPDCIVCVNRYWGEPNSKFRLFFAQENLGRKKDLHNYMVDPNAVIWDTMMESSQSEKILGMVADNTFYMMDLQIGDNQVSRAGKLQLNFIDAMKARVKHFVRLGDILRDAGFTILPCDSTEKPDMDFSNLDKDTILNLMAA